MNNVNSERFKQIQNLFDYLIDSKESLPAYDLRMVQNMYGQFRVKKDLSDYQVAILTGIHDAAKAFN